MPSKRKFIDEHKDWVWGILEGSFRRIENYQPSARKWRNAALKGFISSKELATEVLPHLLTCVEEDVLKHIGKTISKAPEDFNLHLNLKRILAGRTKTVLDGENIDMATAEAFSVRLAMF